MSISIKEIRSISIKKNSLYPEIIISAVISYNKYFVLPINAKGRLVIGQKEITNVELTNEKHFPGQVFANNDLKNLALKNNKNDNTTIFDFQARLDEKALKFIEEQRQKNTNKDVNLGLYIYISYINLTLQFDDNGLNPAYQLPINLMDTTINKQLFQNIEIKQSEWIQKFAEPLGIGKFLLLELKIPESLPSKRGWVKMFKNLQSHLQSMEMAIKVGDWNQVMVFARQFFEDIRLGKNTPLKSKLKDLFEARNGSNVGFAEYYDGIECFFNYYSKFIHTKDRGGTHYEKPIPKSEDAYMAYSNCLALMNLIMNKISQV